MESSLKNLTIDPSAKPKSSKVKANQKTPPHVADSWEDETSSDEEDDEELGNETPTASSQIPSAPPPTPISPSSPQSTRLKTQQENQLVSSLWESSNSIASPRGPIESRRDKEDDRRPEKTDAVAKRMIAGALGIRALKKTDEQKAYERAVREGEMTRREREREEKRKLEEEREKAKRAIWES